jgi:transposase
LSETKKHRKFTVQQKAELVFASFRGDRSIAEICRGRDISEALLRRWRDQMIEAGRRSYRWPLGIQQADHRWRLLTKFAGRPSHST